MDDFIKAGGTAKGMMDLMGEFGVNVVGAAFVMAMAQTREKLIHDEKALMVMHMDAAAPSTLRVRPADWLSCEARV